MLILLGGCGKESVIDPHEVLWGAIGLLPLEVRVPELGGSVVHTTRLYCTTVHANETCVCVGGVWFEGADYPTTNQALFSLVREPKRPYLCTEVSSKLSSKRETLFAELSPLVSHKRIRPREMGWRSGVTFWPSLPGTTCHTHQPLCNRKWHRFINTHVILRQRENEHKTYTLVEQI